jgi:uncharacterized membrane protein
VGPGILRSVTGIRTTTEGGLLAGQRGASGHRAAHLGGVSAVTALVAAIYAAFSLTRYYTLQSTSYDLVIFDQAVRSYAHLRPGISIVKGLHNGFGPNFSVLGDHFSPILSSLAPLYWIHGSPETLLVAQAVLFALAIPPLWIFTRRAFGGGRKAAAAAYLVSAAYGLSWPLAAAAAFDFHEVAFAPVLTAVALERFQASRLRSALITLAVLLFVKEDMGLLVAGIGCYFAVSRPRVVRRQWLVAIALVVVGVAFTAFATYVLIPAFGGRPDYYWAYSSLGRDVPQAAWHMITHPLSSLRLLITPRVKLGTMLWLVGPFCFLPLLSPIVLAAAPFLFERMLNSKFPDWWGTAYQYNAYLVVVLVCAAVDGAARLDRWGTRAWPYLTGWSVRPAGSEADPAADSGHRLAADRWASDSPAVGSRTRPAPTARATGTVALACAMAMCAVAIDAVHRFALGAALHSSFYQRTAQMTAAAAAAATVPSGVTVEAVNHLGPQLSARDTVLLWDGDGKTPLLGAPWVIANVKQRQFTFTNVSEQRLHVRMLERNGYQIIFKRDGYVVLHRGGRRAGHTSSQAAAG